MTGSFYIGYRARTFLFPETYLNVLRQFVYESHVIYTSGYMFYVRFFFLKHIFH